MSFDGSCLELYASSSDTIPAAVVLHFQLDLDRSTAENRLSHIVYNSAHLVNVDIIQRNPQHKDVVPSFNILRYYNYLPSIAKLLPT